MLFKFSIKDNLIEKKRSHKARWPEKNAGRAKAQSADRVPT
jgi:hypothetical protein